ncbi:MAG TPA: alpha/beta hydrolase [Burkholderiales bacterium]|nr:alpha/beta hydrolase [Burkholderiales bacterium]
MILQLSRVELHVVVGGVDDGEPVVLLHGWPQTSHEWRKVIALLAPHYRIVAPDLPGLGESSRPTAYDKKSIATHLREMCEPLGLGRFHLVGHDWGGPTAFALACAIPDRVRTLAILDVTIPGIGPDISQGGRRWHHAFHMTPELPEMLTQGREREYLGWFYREFCWRRDAITPKDIDEYVRCYSQPGAMRAGFEYYRALPQDRADNQRLLESGFRLRMPVLALGGAKTEARGRAEEPLESLRAVASDVRGGAIAECGHFIPEEQPAVLAQRLLEHFAR